jgi:tRNA 2-selenouridine synthase
MFETRIWDKLRRFDPARPVFVESESKKVGNLRVPEAVMERMRASPCVSLQLDRPLRVQLLMEDYHHFCADPAALNAQLDHLAQLHGRARIETWQQMANTGHMPELVDQLLVEHYDPAYLRSIDRNFVQYPKADTLTLPGISKDDFVAAARHLHT